MKLLITLYADWESRIEKIIFEVSDKGLENYFTNKYYGDGYGNVYFFYRIIIGEANQER